MDKPAARLTPASRLFKYVVSVPPFVFLLLFVAPGIIMVLASFRYPGEFGGLAPLISVDPRTLHGVTLETYRFFFSDFIYTEIFIKSILMACVTTLICLIIAYPLALLIARSPQKTRNMMVLLVILPFASNFLIRVYAWMIVLGPQSALSQLLNSVLHLFGIAPVHLLFSPFAVLVAMVYAHLPFMVLPLSLPGVFSGFALVFIPVLGIFVIPEILGGTGDMLIGN